MPASIASCTMRTASADVLGLAEVIAAEADDRDLIGMAAERPAGYELVTRCGVHVVIRWKQMQGTVQSNGIVAGGLQIDREVKCSMTSPSPRYA